MATKNKIDLNYYLSLPWSYSIDTDQDNEGKRIYIISVNELPGVCTDAYSIAEGMEFIKEAMLGAFKLYIKQGDEIPEPIDEAEFKGNIAYRTTSKRHYLLAKEAQKRNLSLSKALDELIDEGLGKK